MKRRRLPKYVSEFKDRHGKMRVIFRRKGQKSYYFKAKLFSREFEIELQACLDRQASPNIMIGASRTKPGSISELIAVYYQAPEFTGLKKSSQTVYRRMLEKFRTEYGDGPVAKLERKHIKAIIGAKSATPEAANKLLDRLKVLMKVALDIGMIQSDPTFRVKGFKSNEEGLHTWTEEEIASFEGHHPIGTKARLAMALMLYTGQRRSDAVEMGWQHVSEGSVSVKSRISVKQIKTQARVSIPMHENLARILAGTERDNLTFLVTAYGNPFTANGFGNWFRDRCNEAGLPQCSAHGLRKAASRRLAESGCSHEIIKSITGHKTDKEVSRYVAAANQQRLADMGMAALESAERERNLSNHPERLDNSAHNPLKKQEG